MGRDENNIYILGNPEWEQKDKRTQNVFKVIMAEDFQNLGRERHPDPRTSEGPK